MFKIYDGREHFYQWDLDRKLIVEDPTIKEVHFCNRTDDCSLVCETYVEDGVTLANVPNILLQTDWKIHVYAYDGSYTKHDECYEVKSRTKPADYEYTETEILNWSRIEERVDVALEDANAATESAQLATGSAITAAINADNAASGANAAASRADEAATLAQITANNMPNYFANALKGNLSGEVVSAKDVSPAEHELNIKASSKNLFKTTNYGLGSHNTSGGGLSNALKNYAMTTDFIYLPSGKYILSNIEGAHLRYISLYNLDKQWTSNIWTGRAKTFKFTIQEDCYVRIDIERADSVDIDNYDTFMHEYQFMLEAGTTATTYTPYLTEMDIDAATLSAYGKNLFNNDVSLVKQLTRTVKAGTVSTKNSGCEIHLPAGEYTLTDKNTPLDKNYYIYITINDKDGNYVSGVTKDKYNKEYGKKVDEYWIAGTDTTSPLTFKLKEGDVVFLHNATGASVETTKNIFNQLNIQLEAGGKGTEYEEYKAPSEYDIYLDGTVPGVGSVYPSTTLMTDTPGVLIECEYNRDITKAFAELEQAIISLGGNV